MSGFLLPNDIAVWRVGNGAPVWRAITTLNNYVALNALVALVASAALWFVLWRLFVSPCAEDESRPPRLLALPFVAALLFLVSPQFGGSVMMLRPDLMSALFPLLAMASAVSGLGIASFVLAGALIALGVWESALGMMLSPLPAILASLPMFRREKPIFVVVLSGLVGFLLAGALEYWFLPTCSLASLGAVRPDWIHLAAFVVALAMLVAFLSRLGLTLATGLLTFMILAAATSRTYHKSHFRGPSASETFVRMALRELGDRKLVIGDGIFTEMIRAFVPDDVRVLNAVSLREKEEVLHLFEQGDSALEKALVLSRFYARREFTAALTELKLPWQRKTQSIWRTDADRVKERQESIHSTALEDQRVRNVLEEMGPKFALIPAKKRPERIDAARQILRRAWENGVRTRAVSQMLIDLDSMRGDMSAMESDAINALIYDRDDPAANGALGGLRLSERKLDLAEEYLTRAIKGEGVNALCDYARLLVEKGCFADAETWARKAVAKSPQVWSYRQPLAAALAEQKKFAEAEHEIRRMERLALVAHQEKSAANFISQLTARMEALRGTKEK